MVGLLICTHDNMLARGLCNPLRDEGYSVVTAGHLAEAIRMMMAQSFGAIVIDPEVLGLRLAEALPVITRVAPHTKVIVIGEAPVGYDVFTVSRPTSLEELRHIIRGIGEGSFNNKAKERV